MAKFLIQEVIGTDAKSARLGTGTKTAQPAGVVYSADTGKAIKLVGNSQYDLCAVGDYIEGFIVAVSAATLDDYAFGSFKDEGYVAVKFEGSQAAGTGNIAVGDYVVCGTPAAKATAASVGGQTVLPNVRKSTAQIGVLPADLTAAGAQIKLSLFAWRVVSITKGTGAVGDEGVIERVNC